MQSTIMLILTVWLMMVNKDSNAANENHGWFDDEEIGGLTLSVTGILVGFTGFKKF
jgi:hypothetical protein